MTDCVKEINESIKHFMGFMYIQDLDLFSHNLFNQISTNHPTLQPEPS